MDSVPQTPTRTKAVKHDTGFPAAFCGSGNTRMRHPEADTSPNASITAEDISVSKVLARSRRSFLTRGTRRTLSHGFITPSMERLQNQASLDDSVADTAALSQQQQPMSPVGRMSKDGTESLGRTDTSGTGDEDSPTVAPRTVPDPAAPAPSPDAQKLGVQKPDTERRRSVLRKLRLG